MKSIAGILVKKFYGCIVMDGDVHSHCETEQCIAHEQECIHDAHIRPFIWSNDSNNESYAQ